MPQKSSKSIKKDGGETPKAPARKRAAVAKDSSPRKTTRKKSVDVSSPELNGNRPGLVIVESPKKATSIGKFLGADYVVKASMGHVRDLPKRKLGLEVADGYKPSYEIVPAKKDTIGDLSTRCRSIRVFYGLSGD